MMARDPRFPWWYPRKSHDAWSRVREKGRWRFVLVNGVGMYGGLMFLTIGLFWPWLVNPGQDLTADRIALSAVVWASAGVAWGALTWYFSERNFLKYAPASGTLKS